LEQVILSSPVLNEGELESLLKDPFLKAQVLPTFFDIRKGVDRSLEKTLNKLCEAADEAVRNGSQLLVLSDRSDVLVSTIQLSFIYSFKTFQISVLF
jgi:glutamate synthase (ferredoxin)